MAKKYIFGIKDIKLNSFAPALELDHPYLINRVLKEIHDNPQSMVAKYPEDYSVYKIATFDTETGVYENLTTHEFILNCSYFKNPPTQSTQPSV